MPKELIKLPLRTTRIKYFDLINKKHERLKIKKKLKQFNTYLKTFGLEFENIQIKRENENDNNQNNDFNLKIVDNMVMDGEYEDNIDLNALCQNAKDQACMSDKSYKKFRETIMPAAKIVSLARCVDYKKKVDEFWKIISFDRKSNKRLAR